MRLVRRHVFPRGMRQRALNDLGLWSDKDLDNVLAEATEIGDNETAAYVAGIIAGRKAGSLAKDGNLPCDDCGASNTEETPLSAYTLTAATGDFTILLCPACAEKRRRLYG